MSTLSQFLFGRPGRLEQIPTVTPEQERMYSQILGGIGAPLGVGLENLQQLLTRRPEAFEAFQAPAMREFREQIIPEIAERFTGLGAQRSSVFPQQLGAAAAGLEERLAAQRAGLQSQALQQLMSLLGIGLQPQFQTMQIPGTEGLAQPFMRGLGTAIGGIGGTALTGGLGGLLAGQGFRRGMRQSFGF